MQNHWIEGLDVSNWQNGVDWRQVRQTGLIFAFCKATEGRSYVDPTFRNNWPAIAGEGMVRGAYHYFYPELGGWPQADFLHSVVHSNGGSHSQDFVALDFEELGGASAGYAVSQAETFVLRVRSTMHRNVVIYTYPAFWIDQLGNPQSELLSSCPLWIADYGPDLPELAAWPEGAAFWQYSSTGRVSGIEGPVDVDRFFGDRTQLKRLAQLPK